MIFRKKSDFFFFVKFYSKPLKKPLQKSMIVKKLKFTGEY
ncbi:hypothetical protein SRA_08356 [Streptococcus ratti FA-1 = DSM 20564]|uniref:Uncharacterized protein n=1 Tax=Streptococcus ratti FA-1 = DSM 20564 TaxID=699248 RepID=A0ABN0GVK0_STRRT|nr:hypothetical protein SRA_08356 [Streptococcus ratti FA-1 = DSM 20564]